RHRAARARAAAPQRSGPAPAGGSATSAERGRQARQSGYGRAVTTDWSYHLTSEPIPCHRRSMAFQSVTRRSVPDEVFDQVLGEVVDGGISAGESLPSERRL